MVCKDGKESTDYLRQAWIKVIYDPVRPLLYKVYQFYSTEQNDVTIKFSFPKSPVDRAITDLWTVNLNENSQQYNNSNYLNWDKQTSWVGHTFVTQPPLNDKLIKWMTLKQ